MNMTKYRIKSGNRNGFTLVEVIVVIAILGIISAAIMTIFQFTMNAFRQTTLRADQQADTRHALDQVKKEVGVAKSVIVSNIIPASFPSETGYGYCYYDKTNHKLILRTMDGKTYEYMQGLPDNITNSINFEPVSAVANTPLDSIQFLWQIGDYQLGTTVYIQNMKYWLGSSVSATYTTGPGIYIQFSN